jgi:hypothetical protein
MPQRAGQLPDRNSSAAPGHEGGIADLGQPPRGQLMSPYGDRFAGEIPSARLRPDRVLAGPSLMLITPIGVLLPARSRGCWTCSAV